VDFVSPLSISYDDFLVPFFSFLLDVSFCILLVYLGAPYAFNKIGLLLLKKNVQIYLHQHCGPRR
jgi:hypothetical protein